MTTQDRLDEYVSYDSLTTLSFSGSFKCIYGAFSNIIVDKAPAAILINNVNLAVDLCSCHFRKCKVNIINGEQRGGSIQAKIAKNVTVQNSCFVENKCEKCPDIIFWNDQNAGAKTLAGSVKSCHFFRSKATSDVGNFFATDSLFLSDLNFSHLIAASRSSGFSISSASAKSTILRIAVDSCGDSVNLIEFFVESAHTYHLNNLIVMNSNSTESVFCGHTAKVTLILQDSVLININSKTWCDKYVSLSFKECYLSTVPEGSVNSEGTIELFFLPFQFSCNNSGTKGANIIRCSRGMLPFVPLLSFF